MDLLVFKPPLTYIVHGKKKKSVLNLHPSRIPSSALSFTFYENNGIN